LPELVSHKKKKDIEEIMEFAREYDKQKLDFEYREMFTIEVDYLKPLQDIELTKASGKKVVIDS